MSNKGKFSNSKGSKNSKSKAVIILSVVAVILLLGVIALILLIPKDEPVPTEPSTVPTTAAPTEAPTEVPTTVEPTTEPVIPPAEMLEQFVEQYTRNPDMVGWIKIDGTKLDNPVMYTPDEPQKYLRADFEGNYDMKGLPYISDKNMMDPEDENLIIYAHNMVNGDMFGCVMNYAKKDFFEEHPIIKFSTLFEEREYEVMACFYDKIYRGSDDVFKFYRFYNAQTQEEFDEAYNYFKEKSEYDTGVTAEMGDRFITLVTCSYHTDNGRFVVIARLIEDKPEN